MKSLITKIADDAILTAIKQWPDTEPFEISKGFAKEFISRTQTEPNHTDDFIDEIIAEFGSKNQHKYYIRLDEKFDEVHGMIEITEAMAEEFCLRDCSESIYDKNGEPFTVVQPDDVLIFVNTVMAHKPEEGNVYDLDKRFWFEVAQRLGEVGAQHLYHAAVFVTKTV